MSDDRNPERDVMARDAAGAHSASTDETAQAPERVEVPGDESQDADRIPLDLVGGLSMLAISGVFILNAGEGTLDWVFPLTMAYGLAIIGVYLVIRGLVGRGDKTSTLLPILQRRGVDVFVFSVLTFVYVALARPVGFWVTSMIMLFAGSVYLDHARSKKRAALAAVVAFVVCIAAYVLLLRIFYVPLPRARWLPF